MPSTPYSKVGEERPSKRRQMQTFADPLINMPITLKINNCLRQSGFLTKKCMLDMPKYKLKVFPSKNYPSLYFLFKS